MARDACHSLSHAVPLAFRNQVYLQVMARGFARNLGVKTITLHFVDNLSYQPLLTSKVAQMKRSAEVLL